MKGFTPPNFDKWQGKKLLNLQFLQRNYSPLVIDYSVSIPDVCVYRKDGSDWSLLRVSGPLFVLTVSNCPDPVLFVLSALHFRESRDFSLPVPVQSTKLCRNESQVYFTFAQGQDFMISTESPQDAQLLVNSLAQWNQESHRQNSSRKIFQPNVKPSKDLAYQHLVRVMSRP
jgi:hypothetical protein